MQPVGRLVFRVQISQFDFANGRGGEPHSKMPVRMSTAVKLYLAHTADGHSIRSLVLYSDVYSSTVLRSVRKIETQRDGLLIVRAVQEFSKYCAKPVSQRTEDRFMSCHNPNQNPPF